MPSSTPPPVPSQDPLPSAPTELTNTHPMVTRSKFGNSKKQIFLSTKHPPCLPSNTYYDSVERTCYGEATKFPEWRRAMSHEFSALRRQGIGLLFLLLQINILFAVVGYINWNTILMVQVLGLNPNLRLKGITKSMVLITRRHSVQLWNMRPLAWFFLLQFISSGLFII